MKTPLLISLAVLLSACSSTAVKAPAQDTYYFNCDVPAGNFSEWSRTISTSAVRVAGTVKLEKPLEHARWSPIASIFLHGVERSNRPGFQILVPRGAPTNLELVTLGAGASAKRETLATIPLTKDPIPFVVSLDKSKMLTVTAAGLSRSVQLTDFDIKNVALSCSTGEFEFADVSITTYP